MTRLAKLKQASAWLILTSMLSACASIEDSDRSGSGSARDAILVANQAAQQMVGRYIGLPLGIDDLKTDDAADQTALVELLVQLDPLTTSDEAVVRLEQTEAGPDGPRSRSFLMSFRPLMQDSDSDLPSRRLGGRFSPIDSSGRLTRSCELTTLVRPDGFVAQTRPDDCRFTSPDGPVGLVKEIAHDGERLVIGDRLINLDSGESMSTDQIIQFDRIRAMRGWAGVWSEAESNWRLASEFQIEPTGRAVVPVDAGGMDLGLIIELTPYRWRPDEPSVLRMRVFDLENQSLLGQAWASWDAEQLGIALPDLQIGLSLL